MGETVREIGSEFWDVPTSDRETHLFPAGTQWFLSGRIALQAIIKDLQRCHSVAMPSWCCDSMVKPFLDAGMEVKFYPVYCSRNLVQEIRTDCDVLFVMDYFGYSGTAPDLLGYRGPVIRDVTHSFLSVSRHDADYTFGSLRKWCGFWTGGFAWTGDGRALEMEASDDRGYIDLRRIAMELKKDYILGRGSGDKGYLKVFEEAESVLEQVGPASAADRDVRLAKRLDSELICTRRRENAAVLMNAFPDWLVFPKLGSTDCPMFVPILVPDGKRNELRRYLIQNEIYCPIHWPISEFHRLTEQERVLYDNELSLVCDQRYNAADMKRMVETIDLFWKEA